MTVKLPKQFVSTRWPGYYWNIKEERLYSCKISGVLRPLTLQDNSFVQWKFGGPIYQISINGKSKVVSHRGFQVGFNLRPKKKKFPVQK